MQAAGELAGNPQEPRKTRSQTSKAYFASDGALSKHLLGVTMSKLIHLYFNYQLGLVSFELTKNICEGRGVLMVSWKYFNKQKIERFFKNKNRVKLLRIQLLRCLN